jgi:uncharacterized protein YndB with AHSA1/START domain
MKTLHKTFRINAPITRVWQALTDPKYIAKWGAGPAKMHTTTGTAFTLWGGDIWGKNIMVDAPNKLAQEWYAGAWETPSILTLALHEKAGATIITLLHSNIPDHEAADIDEGWTAYYFGPMKAFLEG